MSAKKQSIEVQAATYSKPTDNVLELVEYGDFSNARCRGLHHVLANCLPVFDGALRHTFRQFPNPNCPKALLMALAAEAARRQGQYWPMHQALFTYGLTGSFHTVSALAVMLGLQLDKFLDDLHDASLKDCIWADVEAGNLAGVTSAPTLFVGTCRIHGKLTYARLVPLIRHYVQRNSTQVLSTVNSVEGSVIWSSSGYHF